MSRKIGALWVRKTKDGKSYMSGILEDLSGDIRIAVFRNDRKEKEGQPDYQIILSEDRDKQKQDRPSQPQGSGDPMMDETPTSGGNVSGGRYDNEISLEDIPF